MQEDIFEPTEFTKLVDDVEDLAELMADAAERLAQFKAQTIEKFSEEYPEAEIGELFLMNYRHVLRECEPCATCKGYPCQKKSNPGFVYGIEYAPYLKDLTINMIECPYKVSYHNKIKAEKQFAAAKIPKKYLCKSFADYKVDADNQSAVRAAHKAIDEKQGVYFYGAAGTGKTFLVALVAQEILRKGRSVIFSDLSYLLNKMRASFAKDSENDIEEMMKTLKECDVLILDDLGTEYVTEWAAEKMFEIINYRYNEDKQTLITSNYRLGELEGRFNNPTNGKPSVTGTRIVSRLSEMCGKVQLCGDDRRVVSKP